MSNLVIYLLAAVIAVPVFARLGLGSVLGYLVAGVAVGPWGLKLITNVEDILHFAEFGVVLLLFLIGLELEPRKLWALRKPILGSGGIQVLVSTIVLGAIGLAFGLRWQTSLVAGLGLSLSSTAIALQILGEKSLMGTPAGKTGFSILLFQDIAVIPIIALIPLLGFELLNEAGSAEDISTAVIIAVMVAIFVVGRYALRHILNFVASIHLREVFTALSLLLVVGIAQIMHLIGVSMALGAFLAGVLMADSPYRHALESDIQPFKGLLLGLFFLSVGMSMNFGLLFSQPLLIITITLVLMLVKGAVLYAIGRMSKLPINQHWFFTFLLSQGGEFGFVLFGFATAVGAMEPTISSQLVLAIALSMVVTPILMVLHEKIIEPGFSLTDTPDFDPMDGENSSVIIIGFGRFGQVVGRLLMANGIAPTLIDHNPEQLERIRRFGYRSYYGDALRIDVLHSAGAANANIIVLAMDDKNTVNQAVKLIQHEFPDLKIVARAFDRGHALELMDMDVSINTRETFYSALEMGKDLLVELGMTQQKVEELAARMYESDVETMNQQLKVRHDEKAMISIAQSARDNLEQTLAADQEEKTTSAESS